MQQIETNIYMKHRNNFSPTIPLKYHEIHATYAFQLENLFQVLQYTNLLQILV